MALGNRIGEHLVETGLLTPEKLDLALREQQRTGEMIGEVLVNLGFVTEELLSTVLANQSGAAHINIEDYICELEALRLVPEEYARSHNLIPISDDDETLAVAFANVYDVEVIDELRKMTHRRIEVMSAAESTILKAIDKFYGAAGSIEEVIEQAIHSASRRSAADRAAEDELGTPIIQLVNSLLVKALKEDATDIHIEPEQNVIRTRFRIDGILFQGPALPKELQSPVAARIKIMSGMNISETRLPQDGRVQFYSGRRKVDIRVSSFPTIHGENIVLRILHKSRLVLGMERLGMGLAELTKFRELVERPYGMIIVCGPTGSGKTTTLYSTLSYINSLEKNIITIEDPVEYELSVIRQSQVNPQIGFTFADGLRFMLRQDPDVILIGEMRDRETAEMGVRSALTGHLVFSTLHTNDAVGAVTRLLDMGIEPYLLSSTLLCVIAQRLVRLICPSCQAPDTPGASLLTKAELTEDPSNTFARGRGCPECRFTGYRGRTGVFEMLHITPEMSDLIEHGAGGNELRALAERQGMRSMLKDGIGKARRGLTSLEEALRVTYIGSVVE